MTHKITTRVTINDMIFLIDSFPEPYRTKHLKWVQTLLEEGQKLRYSGELENKDMPKGFDGRSVMLRLIELEDEEDAKNKPNRLVDTCAENTLDRATEYAGDRCAALTI
jgi:hypothetical protein